MKKELDFKKLQERAEFFLLRGDNHLAKHYYNQMLFLPRLGKNQRKIAEENIQDINETLKRLKDEQNLRDKLTEIMNNETT